MFNSEIDLNELEWGDRTFEIRSFLSTAALEASLDRCGILHPPWVWLRDDGSYSIVDGYKRLAWAGASKEGRVRCTVYPVDYSPMDLMLRRVEGKIFGAPLNVAEKAQIIDKLAAIIPQKLVAERYCPALNVGSRPEALANWRLLCAADDSVLEAAAREQISERSALELMHWEEDARRDVLNLLKELRCSSSIQKEVLERVAEVAMAQNKRQLDLIRHPEVVALLHRTDLNHRQKTQALRDLLARWRFPRLTAREDRFIQKVASASLPKSIRVVHPPAFEGMSWHLVLSFSSPDELDVLVRKAQDSALPTLLKNLMYNL